MSEFAGFPARMDFTTVPNLFFSAVMPQITDINELKTTLCVIAALYRKKSYPKKITFKELAADAALMTSIKTEDALHKALDLAVDRGTLLHTMNGDEGVYLLNDLAGRDTAAKMVGGELNLGTSTANPPPFAPSAVQPDIFAMYEQNIGMLTPVVAEELNDAEKHYPAGWLRDAIKQAVNQNKRKWNYISMLLEKWSSEGRTDGTHPRDSYEERMAKYAGQRGGRTARP
jgi:DNA replication protein